MHTPSLAYWATVTGIYLTLTDSMYALSVLVNASSRTFKKNLFYQEIRSLVHHATETEVSNHKFMFNFVSKIL